MKKRYKAIGTASYLFVIALAVFLLNFFNFVRDSALIFFGDIPSRPSEAYNVFVGDYAKETVAWCMCLFFLYIIPKFGMEEVDDVPVERNKDVKAVSENTDLEI